MLVVAVTSHSWMTARGSVETVPVAKCVVRNKTSVSHMVVSIWGAHLVLPFSLFAFFTSDFVLRVRFSPYNFIVLEVCLGEYIWCSESTVQLYDQRDTARERKLFDKLRLTNRWNSARTVIPLGTSGIVKPVIQLHGDARRLLTQQLLVRCVYEQHPSQPTG